MCFYTDWLFLVVCDSYFVALFQNKLFFIVKVYINACNLLGTRYIFVNRMRSFYSYLRI